MSRQILFLVPFLFFFLSFPVATQSQSLTLATATPQVLSATCAPTIGGTVVLSGPGLTNTSLVVMFGSYLCNRLVVRPYNQMTCTAQAGVGANLTVTVNSVPSPAKFSYCAPFIWEATVLNTTFNTSRLTVKGINFGNSPTNLYAQVRLPSGALTTNCTNLVILSPHTEFQCDLPTTAVTGEYIVRVNVGGQFNSPSNVVSVTSGLCYSKPGVPQTVIDNALLMTSLRKNSQSLRQLVNQLTQVKANLPSFTANDCCSSSFSYPIGFADLQAAASASYTFKDCVDALATSSESYLTVLKST